MKNVLKETQDELQELRIALSQGAPTIKLPEGNGPVRLSVGYGYTIEIAGVFVKPSASIEVTVSETEVGRISEIIEILTQYVDAMVTYEKAKALHNAGVL